MNIPENYYLYINIGIIAFYCVFVFMGYSKGIAYEAASLVSSLASLLMAWLIAPVLAKLFPLIDLVKYQPYLQVFNPTVNTIAYFAICAIVIRLLLALLLPALKFLTKIPVLGPLNKAVGGIFGFVNATVIVMVLSLLLYTPLIANGNDVKNRTFIKYISETSEKVVSYVIKNTKIDKDNLPDINIDELRKTFENWIIEKK